MKIAGKNGKTYHNGDAYSKWEQRVFEDFKTRYPQLEKEATQLEFVEDGSVFVHFENTAYPRRIDGFEKYIE